jgi:hypothetical protein
VGYTGLEPKWDNCYNYKMNKKFPIVKIVMLIFLSFVWFILVQGEYEMITKPNLQNEFPIIKGIYAVYFLGFILLIIGILIIMLLYSIKKSKRDHIKSGRKQLNS